jgi:hypothetical protein
VVWLKASGRMKIQNGKLKVLVLRKAMVLHRAMVK